MGRVIRVALGFKFAALLAKSRQVQQADFLRGELQSGLA